MSLAHNIEAGERTKKNISMIIRKREYVLMEFAIEQSVTEKKRK